MSLIAVEIAGVRMSPAAAEVVEQMADPAASVFFDVDAIVSGRMSRDDLFSHCIDGADESTHAAWGEYVDAIVAAALGV